VGRHENEWVKWVQVSVSYTQLETKQTNVVVTMATRYMLRIFEIS